MTTFWPTSAHAQFFGDRWGWGGRPNYAPQRPASRGFFFPFFGRRFYSPRAQPAQPAPVESFRAPPPRKPTTQPTSTVVVIGDSMADWLAYGLEEIYADQPQMGVVRKIRPGSGLIHYGPRNDTLQWSQALKEILADQKPAAIVVMLGLNDRVPLRVPPPPRQAAPREGKNGAQDGAQANQQAQKDDKSHKPQQAAGAAGAAPAAQAPSSGEGQGPTAQTQEPGPGTYDFRTDEWAKLYRKRIDDMIAALKSKGVPVLWVGLPALRGPHATADMSYLDDLYRASADKAGIDYVDIWDGFVDEDGRYSVMGPDFEGQTRRLRSGDGIHFTRYGALKLAHLVDQDLSRAIANPVTPAALPTPQASAPGKPGTARPAIGPVLPLTTAGGARAGAVAGGQSEQLLGGSQTEATDPDPVAAAVLEHGDAPPAPADRADNFAWPQPASATSVSVPAAPAASPTTH